MSDLIRLHYFLGIEIYQNGEGVFICQTKYAKTFLEKIKMKNFKFVATPIVVNKKLLKHDGRKEVDATLYRIFVEILLY